MTINWKSPWVIGGAGVAFVLILVAVRSSAGSGSSDTGTSLVAADQTNAQLAQLSTGLDINQSNNNAAMAISANQTGAAVTAGVLSFLTNSGAQATSLATNEAQISGGIANNAISTNATLQLAPQLAEIQSSSNIEMAKIQAEVYPVVAQNQQMLALLSGNTAIGLASLQTQGVEANAMAQENIAGTNADAAVNKQLIATGGQIVSSAVGGGVGGGGGGSGGGSGGLGGFF